MLDVFLLLATLGVTGILGAASAYLALKAFKKARDGSFLLTATGFGLVASATIYGAVACVFLNVYDVTVHIVQSGLVSVALVSIILSISRVRGLSLGTQRQIVTQSNDRRHDLAHGKQPKTLRS